jgi:hypothetical protein
MSAVQQEDVPEAGSLKCIPKATELIAYRAQGAGNISEFLQVVFSFTHKMTAFLNSFNTIIPMN